MLFFFFFLLLFFFLSVILQTAVPVSSIPTLHPTTSPALTFLHISASVAFPPLYSPASPALVQHNIST